MSDCKLYYRIIPCEKPAERKTVLEVAIEYICFICIIVPVIMMTITMTGKSRLLIGSMAMGLFICLFSSELSGFILRELELDIFFYKNATSRI